LGTFEIDAAIGAGGMGEVYRARDTRLNRAVAIKVLAEEPSASATRRFQREATTASALNHPHIVTVHEVGELHGRPYLVTEFVDGGTLADWAHATPRSWRDIVEMLRGVADGLATAHEAGILHRDVKPQNILVSKSGWAKLADFGLATLTVPTTPEADTRDASAMTRPGVVIGTIPYMSPEQASGKPLDARSDIFSFGVVLYELLGRRRPFEGTTDLERLHAVTNASPRPLGADVPMALRMIVDKALEKDPTDRYQSMRELLVDLRKLTRESGQGNAVRPAPAARARWIAATAATAVMVSALVWLATRGREVAPADEPPIRSLAVLPLKPLQQGSGDDHLGLGVADTIITRFGQFERMIVRPIGAVRRYAAVDTDPLRAAAELDVDAVLDGSFQRSGDRLRVNMTLFRAKDGRSIWSNTFNAGVADIFAIEDDISEQVVSQLRLRLSPAERLRLTKHHTSSPEAYEYYLKGVATFSTVAGASTNVIGDLENGIKMLAQAVKIDPQYALAHAQMAWAAAWRGLNSDDGQMWIDRARAALARADSLDRNLAESHIVRHLLLWSGYENYQILPAFEELRTAQRLNPNVGHFEMGLFLAHLGFVEPALRELRRALEIDPTNAAVKSEFPQAYWYAGRYDEAIEEHRRMGADVPWAFFYYLGADRVDESRRLIEVAADRNPANPTLTAARAMLLALEGKHADAQAQAQRPPLPAAARLNRTMHHAAYFQACLWARGANAEVAVDWMKETVTTGMPVYPAFERDRCFESIRRSPQYIQFMASLKPVWDGYERAMR
jgi:eukaryotic-like serine/threonine-protein kinase